MSKKDLLIALLEEMESDLKRIDWQDIFIAIAVFGLVVLWILGVHYQWW
jgi:hypothetical protein